MTKSELSARSARGWSDERRARHAAATRAWAPWKSSTGPRTPEGKHISSLNALKHGNYSRPARAFSQKLRLFLVANRDFLQRYVAFHKNELLKARRLKAMRSTLKQVFKRKSGLVWVLWWEQVSICAPDRSMPIGDRMFRSQN